MSVPDRRDMSDKYWRIYLCQIETYSPHAVWQIEYEVMERFYLAFGLYVCTVCGRYSTVHETESTFYKLWTTTSSLQNSNIIFVFADETTTNADRSNLQVVV